MNVYIVGSLRHDKIIEVTQRLVSEGYSVFSDWYAAGPEADDYWQRYEQGRGRSYREALNSPAAQNVFNFDQYHIDEADIIVMVAPAGKSAHLELGYALGGGKAGFVLMEQEPERWDVMLAFADGIAYTIDELLVMMQRVSGIKPQKWVEA